VAVQELEAGGFRGEVEGEARGGGIEGDEDGVVALAELCRGRTGPWPAQDFGQKKFN
jgi:hypothetical protein